MRRLLASLVVLLLLTAVATPALAAISAPPRHACCLRAHHCSADAHASISASQHDCCPALAVPASLRAAAPAVPATFRAPHDSHPFVTESIRYGPAARQPDERQERSPPADKQ